jgi:hypothetical protein
MTIEQLVEFQRGIVEEKQADLEAEKRVRDALVALCLAKDLKVNPVNVRRCADVGVALE